MSETIIFSKTRVVMPRNLLCLKFEISHDWNHFFYNHLNCHLWLEMLFSTWVMIYDRRHSFSIACYHLWLKTVLYNLSYHSCSVTWIKKNDWEHFVSYHLNYHLQLEICYFYLSYHVWLDIFLLYHQSYLLWLKNFSSITWVVIYDGKPSSYITWVTTMIENTLFYHLNKVISVH